MFTAAFRAERSSALIRFLTVEPRVRYVKEQRRYSDHHCTDDVQHPIRHLVRMPGSRFPAVGKSVNLRSSFAGIKIMISPKARKPVPIASAAGGSLAVV